MRFSGQAKFCVQAKSEFFNSIGELEPSTRAGRKRQQLSE
jgi:hypothetical protein